MKEMDKEQMKRELEQLMELLDVGKKYTIYNEGNFMRAFELDFLDEQGYELFMFNEGEYIFKNKVKKE